MERGIVDDEKQHGRVTSAAAAVQRLVGKIDEEDLDMYKLLQEQYNYTTIDHAPNCKSTFTNPPPPPNPTGRGSSNATIVICVGANWLHHRPKLGKKSEQVQDVYEASADLVPPKHWVWYILTNEGTDKLLFLCFAYL